MPADQPIHLYVYERTSICLDESITDVKRARDMIALGSGKIINIKPGRVGGFTASKAIHDLCADSGIPVWCGGMLESGIGRAHNVALASLPNFSLPGDSEPERALLGARHRVAGMDDGRRRNGRRAPRPARDRRRSRRATHRVAHVARRSAPRHLSRGGRVTGALRRTLGFKDLVFLTLGTVIGSGIFLVPGVVLRQTGGSLKVALPCGSSEDCCRFSAR